MIWRELKDLCNILPESELEKKVMLWREDEAITDISGLQLEEDHFVSQEEPENGCFPKSEMESQIKMSPEDFPEGIEHFTKVYDKGHPVLQENF